MLDIISCGSHWAGERESTIEDLLEVLNNHPLDRTFEKYGNFVDSSPEWIKENPYPGIKVTSFFGNFLTISFVFNIKTDEQPIIDRLTVAIRENQKRPDYLSQVIQKPKQQQSGKVAGILKEVV